MDFTLISLIISLFIGQATLYFWEDPQIPDLEAARRRRLEKMAKKFIDTIGRNPGQDDDAGLPTSFLLKITSENRELASPVRELTPHKKIRWLLSGAFVLSFAYGLLNDSLSYWNLTVFKLLGALVGVTDILAIIAIGLAAIAFWYGIQEFIYILEIRKILNEDES
ncbi:MAG: hypothetical protein K9K66_10395 [Desulfarculaceae bacterium]|nr:hypothetical protein [Desulfarculaceae bacterium]MCF8073905.1 hypothetical protein [Desulfarculaceae bacterium]MCF8102058.1 hypothetical protein [Desulfarculaceae bacterium]MCF8116329.1 hypothetical protein [Desulfarculaceae bacterium]